MRKTFPKKPLSKVSRTGDKSLLDVRENKKIVAGANGWRMTLCVVVLFAALAAGCSEDSCEPTPFSPPVTAAHEWPVRVALPASPAHAAPGVAAQLTAARTDAGWIL